MKVRYKDMLLYAVTDNRWLGERSLVSQVEDVLKNGATFLQLRHKDATHEELVREAMLIKPVAAKYNVPFVIDDDVLAAKEADVDGVHIGQSDAAYSEARAILGSDKIIGMTAKTVQQAKEAEALGADYIGTGAVFGSTTKSDAVYMPKELLVDIADSVDIPVVAIGGINYDNMDYLKNTGVSGVAVVSAIFASDNPGAATATLRAKAEKLFSYSRKNIIFDLDGTLFDSMPFWGRVSGEYALSKGAAIPEDFYDVTYTMDLNECGRYFQDVLKRTDEFFQEEIVPLEGKAENILIVAHGCVVRSFILNFTKRPLSEFWKTPFGRNCSSAAFEYKNGEINMIYENKLYYDVDCPDWQQQVPVYKKGRAR